MTEIRPPRHLLDEDYWIAKLQGVESRPLYRPDAPVVEHPGEYYGVKGVCKGKIGGVIVLRNCSFAGFGGPDW